MRTLSLIACFVLAPVAVAAGGDIRTYRVHVVAPAEGAAAVTVTATFDSVGERGVAVPVGFPGVTDLTIVDAPAGTVAVPGPVNGQTTVRVTFPAPSAEPTSVTFRFTVPTVFVDTKPAPGERATLPDGSRLLRHAFVNTEALAIGEYRAEFVFPAGSRAHAVRESAPRLRKGEVGPRVRLADLQDGPGARLQVTRLRQGDSASMTVELIPQSRTWAFFAAGALLSVLYLIYFKDLVGKTAA